MTTTGIDDLRDLVTGMTDDEVAALVEELPPDVVAALNDTSMRRSVGEDPSPSAQAEALDEGFVNRSHLRYLSDILADAVTDVEAGRSRKIAVSMPPRMGKTTLASIHTPLWVLRRHPEWPIALVSHEASLATSWGRQIRRYVEQHPDLGIRLAADAGAVSEWETVEGGGVVARGIRSSLTGRGARFLGIDDPFKDFVEAHSATVRQFVWNWWLAVGQLRLEPPYLVVVTMTRWHEDDLIGRLLSDEHEGDPDDWTVVRLPGVAEEDDPLGREPDEPMLSPLIPDEDEEQAAARWADLRRSVGTYTFSGMVQQRPAPAAGAIFDTGWWRFWSTDPARATDDGRVIHVDDPDGLPGTWIESWDCAFKDTDGSDYVVGQRWVRWGVRRLLVRQQRDRMTFTRTVKAMQQWADDPRSKARARLVEDKANGTAVIDTLKDAVSGLIPVNPTNSKEARARAVTPEVEAGNVYLPHPADPGNEWVADLLSELRDFPHAAHDDQVDALTQALINLSQRGQAKVSVPGGPASAGGTTNLAITRRTVARG